MKYQADLSHPIRFKSLEDNPELLDMFSREFSQQSIGDMPTTLATFRNKLQSNLEKARN